MLSQSGGKFLSSVLHISPQEFTAFCKYNTHVRILPARAWETMTALVQQVGISMRPGSSPLYTFSYSSVSTDSLLPWHGWLRSESRSCYMWELEIFCSGIFLKFLLKLGRAMVGQKENEGFSWTQWWDTFQWNTQLESSNLILDLVASPNSRNSEEPPLLSSSFSFY